jgi:DNA polymerase III subunit delta'
MSDAQQNPELFWLEPQLAQLRQARAQDRLPHGLLIQDAPGGGGGRLALLAAQTVLCREPAAPCRQCSNCRQVEEQRHPDLWMVGLEKDAQQIKVDQIRELCASLSLTGYSSQASVAIIDPAAALNANAANALLKTLEEPRAGVMVVLVAGAGARLPATLISRCQRMCVQLPGREACLAWLRQAGGAGDWETVLDVLGNGPLRALAVAPAELRRLRDETHGALEAARQGQLDVAATAERWVRDGFDLRLSCAENWVTQRILGQMGSPAYVTKVHTGAHLPAGDSSMNIRGLFRLADQLRELAYLATTSINKSLALEHLLWQVPRAAQS